MVQELTEVKVLLKKDPQNPVLVGRHDALYECHRWLTTIRLLAIHQLTLLKSPVLVEYTLERFDLGSEIELDREYIDYYAAVGAVDALLRVLEHPYAMRGSGSFKVTVYHLRSATLSSEQKTKFEQLLANKTPKSLH